MSRISFRIWWLLVFLTIGLILRSCDISLLLPVHARNKNYNMKRQRSEELLPVEKKAKTSGHWSMKLFQSMKDPNLVVESDNLTVTIKDAFPKARHHYLILPKEHITSLNSLDTKHLDLLKHMDERSQSLIKRLVDKNPELEFRHGYHAIPSMSQLHMHIISQDFESSFLKTKKHWNSFTSNFFIDSYRIIDTLKTQGKIEFDRAKYEYLLKSDLQCHKCGCSLKTMPALKLHVKTHLSIPR